MKKLFIIVFLVLLVALFPGLVITAIQGTIVLVKVGVVLVKGLFINVPHIAQTFTALSV